MRISVRILRGPIQPKTVREQNYFQFKKQYYIQRNGLAMGDPTSAILAETKPQHMERKYIQSWLNNCMPERADEGLVIFCKRKTNTDKHSTEFNKEQTNIKFTIENEINNAINFLGFTIHRKNTKP